MEGNGDKVNANTGGLWASRREGRGSVRTETHIFVLDWEANTDSDAFTIRSRWIRRGRHVEAAVAELLSS